ncbi:hypothetical protein KUTeg_014866 [Tegillarca granosa]|uniref:Uncharacterized protein n=1 Tax=Tegillarca granosa TaxID=220873 RepID=A0ABQ9EQQ8_TEGGR|nr:hypothetical protein KUTeg_014866 [Tegillarca granosa]
MFSFSAVHEEAIVHNKPVHVKSQHPHVVKVPKPMVQEVPHFIERTVVITKDIPERQYYPVPQHNFVVRQEYRPRPFDAPFKVPTPVIQNVPQVKDVKVPKPQVVEVPTPVEKVEVVNVPEVKRVPHYIRKDIKVPFKVDVPVKQTGIRTVEVPAPFKVTRKVPQIVKQTVHVPEYVPVVKRIKQDVPVFLRRQVPQRVPFPVNIGQIFVTRFFGNHQHIAQARAQGLIPAGARATVVETGPLVSGTVGAVGITGETIQPAVLPSIGNEIGQGPEGQQLLQPAVLPSTGGVIGSDINAGASFNTGSFSQSASFANDINAAASFNPDSLSQTASFTNGANGANDVIILDQKSGPISSAIGSAGFEENAVAIDAGVGFSDGANGANGAIEFNGANGGDNGNGFNGDGNGFNADGNGFNGDGNGFQGDGNIVDSGNSAFVGSEGGFFFLNYLQLAASAGIGNVGGNDNFIGKDVHSSTGGVFDGGNYILKLVAAEPLEVVTLVVNSQRIDTIQAK